MTVVLLDPEYPTLVPLEALALFTGPVEFTEEVPVRVRWVLADAVPAGSGDSRPVLLSADPRHDEVCRRIDAGEKVVGADRATGRSVLRAIALMERVRREGLWESEQTHRSLRRFLIEETWELADAIAAADGAEAGSAADDDLRGELGDLLLQVLFHAAIAGEDGRFDIDDVADALITKLAGRMPHFFDAGPPPADIEEQERIWAQRKVAEGVRESCLDGIASGQPALALTQKVVERALAAGLPRDCVPDALLRVEIPISGGESGYGGAAPDSAELRQRADVLEFAARVREAEGRARSRAARAGEEYTGPTVADWRGGDE